jgi:hypothetical protein
MTFSLVGAYLERQTCIMVLWWLRRIRDAAAPEVIFRALGAHVRESDPGSANLLNSLHVFHNNSTSGKRCGSSSARPSVTTCDQVTRISSPWKQSRRNLTMRQGPLYPFPDQIATLPFTRGRARWLWSKRHCCPELEYLGCIALS